MNIEAKWGKPAKSERRVIRGLVRKPGFRGVEIEVRGEKSQLDRNLRWSFEACGPGGLSARSMFVYDSAEEAIAVATVFAEKILDVLEGQERVRLSLPKKA